jgi:hypothetical protein
MAFTKQDLISAGIPVDITIETIYQEYKNGGLTLLPRASLSQTIRNKYPGIKTLEDLFENAPNTKAFLEFQQGILSMAPTICAIYKTMNTVVSLPLSIPPQLTLENGLRAFLKDYISAKKKYARMYGGHILATDRYCQVLECFFDEHSTQNDRGDIASLLNVKRQSVDNKLKMAHDELEALFLNGATISNISVCPSLAQMVQQFKADFIVPGMEDVMIKLSGIKSRKMRELLATILGYTILDTGIVKVNGAAGMPLILNKGKVKSILKREGIPISFNDFKILLGKNIQDAVLRDDLEQFVKCNNEFELFQDASGLQKIAVKWEYLNDLDSEIIRILYDNNAWDPKNAMSNDNLQLEWERRAKQTGRRKIKFDPTYKHWRLCPTKNGYVMLRWYKGDNFVPGQKYVMQLIANNPQWTFDQLFHQAHKDGYTNIYPFKTLRAYYTDATNDNSVERAIKATIKYLDNSPQQSSPFSDLLKHINNQGIQIGYGPLRRWLQKNNQSFLLSPSPSGKIIYVKLLSKKMPLITKKGQSYNNTISNTPTRTSNQASVPITPNVDWNSIKQFILTQVSETQKYPTLANSVDNLFFIMKDGQSSLNANSIFLGWLPDLTHSNTMTSWVKDKFRKDMLGSIEAFASLFYRLKYGSDLVTDIVNYNNFRGAFAGGTVQTPGLGSYLRYLESKGALPNGAVYYAPNTIEKDVTLARKNVKDARDKMVGHQKATVNLADNIMSAQIHDTLLLFLYWASL